MKLLTSYITIFLLLSSLSSHGQNQLSDHPDVIRLNQVLQSNNSHDTSIASAYMELSGIYYLSNIDTIFTFSELCRQQCEKGLAKTTNAVVRNRLLVCKAGAYNNDAFVLSTKGQNELALKNYTEAMQIQQVVGDMDGLALSINNIGQVLESDGKIQNALDCYQKSRIIQEQNNLQKGLAITLNNIGLIYKKQDEFDAALDYYNKSLEIRKSIDDQHGVSNSLNNIGSLYKAMGDNETSLMYCQQAYEIRLELSDQRGIANSLSNMGGIYASIGENETALEFYKQSLSIRKENNFKSESIESLLGIAKIYRSQGYNAPAKEIAEEAFKIANELGYPERIGSTAELLSVIYEEEKRGMDALQMYKLHASMSDSLHNEEVKQATVAQQAEYEYEKQKSLDDAEHEKQLLFEQEEQQKQEIITWAVVAGLLLVVIFLAFIFNRLRITRKQKDEIGAQKIEIEKAHEHLEEKSQEILDSINYAKRIQTAILPPNDQLKELLKDAFVLYLPKDIVAGDFYWLEPTISGFIYAAADCTGHGVPGAMVSVICNNALNRSVREYGLTNPGKILDKTREIVIDEFEKSADEVKDGMDIAMCKITGDSLEFAGANNPLWIIRDGTLIETKGNKQPIGKFDVLTAYDTHAVNLQKNDLVYIFSDGFADQFGGPKGKKYKSENFKQLLLSIADLSLVEQEKAVRQSFEDWKGSLEQLDDICIIGYRH